MRIAIIVEGKTEKAFKPALLEFLKRRLHGAMPKIDIVPFDGRVPKGAKLKRVVERLLGDRKSGRRRHRAHRRLHRYKAT